MCSQVTFIGHIVMKYQDFFKLLPLSRMIFALDKGNIFYE